LAIWAADVCSRAARQLICIEPTGLRLRHIGKTDPQCGTVQFCFYSGRLTCSARTGFRAVTTPLRLRDVTHVPSVRVEGRVVLVGRVCGGLKDVLYSWVECAWVEGRVVLDDELQLARGGAVVDASVLPLELDDPRAA